MTNENFIETSIIQLNKAEKSLLVKVDLIFIHSTNINCY